MKLFYCKQCGQLLYFENTGCLNCGHGVGYLWETNQMVNLVPDDQQDIWRLTNNPAQRYRYCANAQYDACNWLIPAEHEATFCRACQLNRTIPNLNQPDNLDYWRKMERAKHRLIYTLIQFRLSFQSKSENEANGLAFDFLADDPTFRDNEQVITGHAAGVITINIKEADDAERERQRLNLGERYRTLLGHFRHESGHYYWAKFSRNDGWLREFRSYFGDEQRNYGEALTQHYQTDPPPSTGGQFISVYATAHPWEDWAETWAHYLRIVDTLETAYAYGLQLDPQVAPDESLDADIDFNAYRTTNFDTLMKAWPPVTSAVNSINRSMGQPDLYPFVLSTGVVEKMHFVHRTILDSRTETYF